MLTFAWNQLLPQPTCIPIFERGTFRVMLNQVTGADTSPVFGYRYPPDPPFQINRHEKHETESTKPDRSVTMDVDIRPETDMLVTDATKDPLRLRPGVTVQIRT